MDLGLTGKKALALPSPLLAAQTIAFFPFKPRSILTLLNKATPFVEGAET